MNDPKTDTILLAIHPLHVANILRGEKRFELRRRIPFNIKRLVIYSTAPESRITAVADVEEVLFDTPTTLWDKVREAACVEHDFYTDYFAGSKQAFALRIGRVRELSRKILLSHSRLRFSPPQSFRYISEQKVKWLLDYTKPKQPSRTRKNFIGGIHEMHFLQS